LVSSYQREYRWDKIQVIDVLDDIYGYHLQDGKEKKDFYRLEPIVVSKINNEFILIDGQQRLTTIYIILSNLMMLWASLEKNKFNLKFSLKFKTRLESEAFLKNIDSDRKS
jgi:hypothetical protein